MTNGDGGYNSWYNLTREQLEKLPTHRLLTVYKKMQSSCHHSDLDRKEFVKSLLDNREHVERK